MMIDDRYKEKKPLETASIRRIFPNGEEVSEADQMINEHLLTISVFPGGEKITENKKTNKKAVSKEHMDSEDCTNAGSGKTNENGQVKFATCTSRRDGSLLLSDEHGKNQNLLREIQIVCTPQHLIELVIGRLFAEGIIDSITDVDALTLSEDGSKAEVTLLSEKHRRKTTDTLSPEKSGSAQGSASGITSSWNVDDSKWNLSLSSYENESEFRSSSDIPCINKKSSHGFTASDIFAATKLFQKGSAIHKITAGTHSCTLLAFSTEAPDAKKSFALETPSPGAARTETATSSHECASPGISPSTIRQKSSEEALLQDNASTSCTALLHREDLNKRNALDKIIGAALLQGIPLHDKAVFSSGRVLLDMTKRAIRAGVPMIISKSVPSAQAVEMAKEHRLTVVTSAWPDNFRLVAGNISSLNRDVS